MITGVAHAIGAPCPTAVLDLRDMPQHPPELVGALSEVRARLHEAGLGHVLKLALAAPSADPFDDLDYRFVQVLPGIVDRFDFMGSCGHSILAAAAVGARAGWLRSPQTGIRVRVKVLNNGTRVVCTPNAQEAETSCLGIEFLNEPAIPLSDLLLTGAATSTLAYASRRYHVSLVSMGNPYVFVDATALGLPTPESLFSASPGLENHLLGLRRAAARLLGWSQTGAFPKIAVIGAAGERRLYARALSVPSWHPTLALTGASCLAAATAIPGTIPYQVALRAGSLTSRLEVLTPGGITTISRSIDHQMPGSALRAVAIDGKEVTIIRQAADVYT
jgi:2-methylaconitate cis-trans-isomerase PrpF